MIIVHVLAAVFGAVLVGAVLISALETVVLPRDGFTRITRFVFAVADRVLIHRWHNHEREMNLRALYAPVALISLPLVWMISVTIGFSFVFWGIKTGTTQRAFEVSGSSLFTLGFAEPKGTARIWLTFVEATIGLGLVALLISYLPTIYSAHHQREKGIIVLRPFAGTPPSPIELLVNLHRLGSLDSSDLWRTTASWLLELDQTHTAFPALCYFPESSNDQSWVASVGSVLDAAALLLSTMDLDAGDGVADSAGRRLGQGTDADAGLRHAEPGQGRDVRRAPDQSPRHPARAPRPGRRRAAADRPSTGRSTWPPSIGSTRSCPCPSRNEISAGDGLPGFAPVTTRRSADWPA